MFPCAIKQQRKKTKQHLQITFLSTECLINLWHGFASQWGSSEGLERLSATALSPV